MALRVGLRLQDTEPPPPTDILSQSDITYVGAIRVPTAIDTALAYGGLGGRKVSGDVHLFLYSGVCYPSCTAKVETQVVSASSTTVFTIQAGYGAEVEVGNYITVKRAATGDALPESVRITNISTDTLTVTPALGGTPVAGDLVGRTSDYGVYEIDVTGVTPDPDYTAAPRGTLYATWNDPYRGRRVGWRNDGSISYPLGFLQPAGLYYNEDTQLLYMGYYDAYNSTLQPWQSFCAASLDNAVTGALTPYGPWLPEAVDANGNTWLGAGKGASFVLGLDGSLCMFGSYFVSVAAPWGPQLYGGGSWPTTATPSGFGADNIELPDRMIDHYFMGVSATDDPYYTGNFFDRAGLLHGSLMSFRRPTSPNRPYIFEQNTDSTASDPALNGFCSWAWTDGLGGAFLFEGTHKRGALFFSSIAGSVDDDPDNVTAAHTWYLNNGVGTLTLTGVTGTFVGGETITGGTSGTTAVVSQWATPLLYWGQSPPGDDFDVAEVVTGGTSGATGTISVFYRASVCNHGFGPPDVVNIAGPVTTATSTMLTIYDPDLLTGGGSGITPASWIDLTTTYGIQTPPATTLLRGNLNTGYFDPDTNYLYLISNQADFTAPYATNSPGALIHVFHLADTP